MPRPATHKGAGAEGVHGGLRPRFIKAASPRTPVPPALGGEPHRPIAPRPGAGAAARRSPLTHAAKRASGDRAPETRTNRPRPRSGRARAASPAASWDAETGVSQRLAVRWFHNASRAHENVGGRPARGGRTDAVVRGMQKSKAARISVITNRRRPFQAHEGRSCTPSRLMGVDCG